MSALQHQQFEEFVDNTERQLDAVVETGSDQELFIASYLHGHFSLVVSQVAATVTDPVNALLEQMQSSLRLAFEQGELADTEQQQVACLWRQLCVKGGVGDPLS